ncbi:MAG: hypothetical protein HY696_00650 [Deltaproteobacteria bacterium]|nr:hypothetical protein [Deltaproteobacteria bacterium]
MQTSLAHIAIRRIAIAELLRVQDNEIDRAVRDSANPWIGLPDLLREPPEARSPEITRLVPTPTHFPGVYRIVTTSTHDRAYTQDAILMSAYQTIFAAQLAQLRALSGDGYALSFVESGFFAALLQGGILMCSDIVTSHSADEIFESDLESAARQLLGRCHPTQLIRMQFYHTHPGAPMGRTISRGDVDYALRLRATVAAYGARVAVDMHALPFEWAFLGESAYYDPNRREFVAQRFDPILLRATIPVAP